ncbi:MAG: peptidylprolyl isomerase, partial [Nitrospinota bacterium]
DEKLIIQLGKEKEVDVSAREVDETAERFRKRVGASEEQFKELLAAEGMTMERYREMLKDQLLSRKVISREVQSQVKLTEDDITEYYEKQSEEFKTAPIIRARHILLVVNEDAGEARETAVLNEIRRIRQEIIDGLDFAEAAKKYSEGPSGPNGGGLGEVKPGMMVKPFEEAAFSLKPGEVSGPVRTRFGYHLIKVDSKKESKLRPLEEVRNEVEKRIYQKIVTEVRDDWIKRIKKGAFIDIKMGVN